MLGALAEAAASGPAEWSVYVVRCADDSLYTGIAKSVERRLAQHNSGRGAAYTRSRRPVRLHYREDGFTRSGALVREARVKRLPRAEKEGLGR
jgi:predicted GIY-YIG superfamily endonuclease